MIAPIVHAARRAWRFVHAPGKLLPEWEKCTPEEKREVFDVVRDVVQSKRPLSWASTPEMAYVAIVAVESVRALFTTGELTIITPQESSLGGDAAEAGANVAAPSAKKRGRQ